MASGDHAGVQAATGRPGISVQSMLIGEIQVLMTVMRRSRKWKTDPLSLNVSLSRSTPFMPRVSLLTYVYYRRRIKASTPIRISRTSSVFAGLSIPRKVLSPHHSAGDTNNFPLFLYAAYPNYMISYLPGILDLRVKQMYFCFVELDPLAVVKPFVEVIKADDTTGLATGLAIASLHKLITAGFFDVNGCGNAKESVRVDALVAVVDALTHCRFESTDHRYYYFDVFANIGCMDVFKRDCRVVYFVYKGRILTLTQKHTSECPWNMQIT
eukprot:1346379-Amorphochlora_amoeboformis.AAC.2